MKAEQIFQYIQSPEKLNQETLPFLKELTQRHPAFEAGWILYLKNLKNINDSSFEQELINGAMRIQDRRKLFLFLNQNSQESVPKKSAVETVKSDETDIFNLIFAPDYRLETVEKTEERSEEILRSGKSDSEKKFRLIDKFLEAQPKMPAANASESDSPMDVEEQNKDDHEDFVTETLASIYAQQGYYKKAIQIFEKLSLKNPEKSIYFAAQIEKIKNLMNN